MEKQNPKPGISTIPWAAISDQVSNIIIWPPLSWFELPPSKIWNFSWDLPVPNGFDHVMAHLLTRALLARPMGGPHQLQEGAVASLPVPSNRVFTDCFDKPGYSQDRHLSVSLDFCCSTLPPMTTQLSHCTSSTERWEVLMLSLYSKQY